MRTPDAPTQHVRNDLGDAFVRALLEDFRCHGPTAVGALRNKDPSAYLRVVASVIPKNLRVDVGFSLVDLLASLRETDSNSDPTDASE